MERSQNKAPAPASAGSAAKSTIITRPNCGAKHDTGPQHINAHLAHGCRGASDIQYNIQCALLVLRNYWRSSQKMDKSCEKLAKILANPGQMEQERLWLPGAWLIPRRCPGSRRWLNNTTSTLRPPPTPDVIVTTQPCTPRSEVRAALRLGKLYS